MRLSSSDPGTQLSALPFLAGRPNCAPPPRSVRASGALAAVHGVRTMRTLLTGYSARNAAYSAESVPDHESARSPCAQGNCSQKSHRHASVSGMCDTTAVLPKIPHPNSCKRVPNRPLRGRRGRFGTLLQLLECGIFGRTAVTVRRLADYAISIDFWRLLSTRPRRRKARRSGKREEQAKITSGSWKPDGAQYAPLRESRCGA